MSILISIIALFSVLTSCEAQNQKEITSLGTIVSEVDNNIWAIYQDQKQNYWFGSNGRGLYRYDGKKIRRFTEKDGLIDNTIRGIQEDSFGNIFIETPKGVSKYDGKQFISLKSTLSPKNEWKLEPSDLWFSCNATLRDVYRYDGEHLFELQLPRKDIETVLGIREDHLSYNPYVVFGIDKDKEGNIWFGTILAGAFRYDGTSFLWVGEKELSRLDDGREPAVRSMLEDKDGNVWLSNFKSKYKVTSENVLGYEKLKAIDPSHELLDGYLPHFNAGLVDNNANLWMTTYGGGAWSYDGEKLVNYPVKEGTEEALLITIYEDNQGVLWLGANNLGVYKFNGSSFEKFEP